MHTYQHHKYQTNPNKQWELPAYISRKQGQSKCQFLNSSKLNLLITNLMFIIIDYCFTEPKIYINSSEYLISPNFGCMKYNSLPYFAREKHDISLDIIDLPKSEKNSLAPTKFQVS